MIGYVISFSMILRYRPDGQSKKKYELYLALIGPFLWPLQLIKFALTPENIEV